ncbi:DUF5704 domain-containing protein [Paenibacillus sp. N3/727]|uniref:DUF5704 domain-containing protein n=1 Tax=Paenibacillus sp. N3/727 TaxID=2925845 RepID=UPI001F539166|nr:DUF5704 domain-containing protein [Paenibacillus sp. N3/727]UNK17673.1 DUF5704 domain-containing protein [Paenibacillus sp. N3/727]
MKKLLAVLLVFTIFLLNIENITYAKFLNRYPTKGIEVNPAGLAYKKQTIKVTVKGESKPNPKTVWTQTDTTRWIATLNNGEQVFTDTHGSGHDAVPTKQLVKNKINTFNYAPESLRDDNDNPFKRDKVKELGIEDINYIDHESYEREGNKPDFEKGKIFATLNTYTGYPLVVTKKEQYGSKPNGEPKFNAHYYTPLEIFYIGYVTETKELKVSENATLKKGQTKQLKAEVRTKEYDMDGFTDPVDVSKREQTEWISDKATVASVDPKTGVVKAEGKGTAKITAKWKNGPYYIYDYVTITVDGDKPPCKPGEPGCEETPPPPPMCTVPEPGTVIPGKYMDPVAMAVIKADQRGGEQFDVLQGIPTSESLYANILARNYLYQNKFVNMTGTCTFTVNVEKTWTLTWDPGKTITVDGKTTTVPDPQSDQETVTQTHIIERPYSFWAIDNLEVYKIDQGILRNYALPGGEISIGPEGYQEPEFTAEQTGDFYPPPDPGTITAPGGSKNGGKSRPSPDNEDLKSFAEAAVGKVEVTNDSLDFNNQTIINGERVDEKGPKPGSIPAPTQIGQDVLYSPNHMISKDKVNRANTTSAGEIFYGLIPGNINGGSDQKFSIHGINTVTVHTPVVNYSSVTDDQAHNQKTNPNYSRAAFILERPFKVRIPTNGQHVNYPGYGNRDYAKYFRTKQVKFPFDTYNGSRTIFYPKDTWIDIPVNQLDTEFFLPVWVDEGDYQVHFRNIAENAPVDFSTQPSANQDLSHHVATDIEPVEVIGRVYDFRITDIVDYNWETVFRTQKGSATPRGTFYWTGQRDIDGDPRGNQLPFTLPIAPGKHPQQGYKNISVKTGYHFKFDLKTKGNMFSTRDGISITPSFFFVKKDGSGRQPVDLYYHSSSRNFIRIGSPQDTEKRYVILNERLRNVPQSEMQDTASYLYNHGGASGGMSAQAYAKQYMNKISKSKTWVGRYDWMLLPSGVRTLIGPKTGLPPSVNSERANAAVQRWYGEYSIPSDVYVVKKGTDLAAYGRGKGIDEKSDVFLKKGFIVVNFNIETIQNGNIDRPHLQYIHAPLMNQWKLEGFKNTYTDPYGYRFALTDGDTVFYHADQSSKKDFSSQVPH